MRERSIHTYTCNLGRESKTVKHEVCYIVNIIKSQAICTYGSVFWAEFVANVEVRLKWHKIVKKYMATSNKSTIRKDLLVKIISIIILAYSFYIGMLLWGLIVVVFVIFIWVFLRISIFIREYIELNKKHIELCDRYLIQKMKQLDDEIKSGFRKY